MTGERRVRALAALAGLAAVGIPAAGFAGALSPEARVALLVFGGWVVPAILCAPLARRFVTGAGVPALAFFLALSLHAAWSEAFRLLGARFSVYADALTWFLLLAYGTVIFSAWARRRDGPTLCASHPRVARGVLLVGTVAALVAIAAWSRGDFSVEEDAYDHVGYVRRVIDHDTMQPGGPLALPVGVDLPLPPDPRKGALHATVAWIASLSGANPVVVWSMLPLVLYPAVVLAFVAFSRALLPRRETLLVCVALFMLSYGGTAFQLAAASAYGQSLAAAWFWVVASLVLCGRDEPAPLRRRRALAAAALSFCGVLVHVGVAFHTAVFAASLALFARWMGLGYRRATRDAAILTAAAGVAAVVRVGLSNPGANIVHSHVQGVLFVGDRLFVASPFEILRQFGMVFLGGLVLLPLLAVALRRGCDARAVLALAIVPVCIAFVPPLATALFAKGSYMVFRALLNAPVLAASAIVVAAVAAVARGGRWWVRIAATAALAAWALAFVRPALDATRADAWHRPPGMDEATQALIRSAETLPANSTVLSDPATAYLLNAYGSHRFVALYEQHANPRDRFALDRLEAVRDVLSPCGDAVRAVEGCRRYAVDYVILNRRPLTGGPGFMTGWDAALYDATRDRLSGIGLPFRPIETTPDFSIFRVDKGMAAALAPDPLPAPVAVDSQALPPCAVAVPDRVFDVAGLSVTPSLVAPGDSVTITIGYRRDQPAPFGLPFLAHVRFDHESLAGGRAYPGEKYLRRFADRRRGVVTRYRADFRPGAGVYEPDLWPMGAPLRERVGFVIPRNALPGSYRVELRVIRDSLLPNFHARDLMFNRDHYSGTACGSLEVRARVGESP